MTPSQEIWEQAAPLRAAMRDMPFNAELAAGTLSRARFRHYMLQDAAYLVGYARVLALAAAKAPTPEDILDLAKAAETAIVVERSLHAGYLDAFGVSRAEMEKAKASPTCAAYVNFLLAEAATGSFASLIGAILPCFWVYREVGLHISAKSAPGNFYQTWIDTYADAGFGEACARMIATYDRAALAAGGADRARMEAAFLTCCRYEWMFWDAAHREEAWPV